jgi:hypothetical protein
MALLDNLSKCFTRRFGFKPFSLFLIRPIDELGSPVGCTITPKSEEHVNGLAFERMESVDHESNVLGKS